MKNVLFGLAALAAGAAASPVAAPAPQITNVARAASDNPFEGKVIYANPYYASEVSASAIPTLSGSMAAAASAAAGIGSFAWLDSQSKVPQMAEFLADIDTQNKAGASPEIMGAFVVYDLPDRDCDAAASNGEFSVADNGLNNYKGYIDQITANLKNYSDVSVALIIEPDSLPNLVTNSNVPKCQEAAPAYKAGVAYALEQLNLPNVAMYIDAGHAGWLGWPANLAPAAQLFAEVYQSANSPAAVRGLATNTANYNAFSIETCPSYTQGATNCDEQRYINALAPLLTNASFPAHFVTDTSRNGMQPTGQLAWGDWCNAIGTGFGVPPTTDTGNDLVDAFVWIKPGGECDGTSNSSAPRYDYHCAQSDALQPSPQAGLWFEAYFEQLLKNANPPLA